MGKDRDRKPIPLVGGGALEPVRRAFSNVDVVDVAVVHACLQHELRWFLVTLDTGKIAVCQLHVVEDRALWTLVSPYELGDGLKLDARGVPEMVETVECPICAARIDVTFGCEKTIHEVYTTCPKCGFDIMNVDDCVVDDVDDDDADDNGGTAER